MLTENPTGMEGYVIEGRYRIEKCLGRGGMGHVFLATHLQLQKVFALKLITAEGRNPTESPARFRLEATILGRLDHPHIVRVTDFGVYTDHGNPPYLVMELLQGETLDHLIQRGPLSWKSARPILESIAQAIDYAHANSVIHGDLKPSNIFLASREQELPVVKILDFGLARILDSQRNRGDDESEATGSTVPLPIRPKETAAPFPETAEHPVSTDTCTVPAIDLPAGFTDHLTGTGSFLGTPQYVSPEAIQRKRGAASDIYAFGLICFELLTGQRPFTGNAAELIRRHLSEVPPPPSSLCPNCPASVDRLILDMLAKDPALRPAGAVAIVARLDRVFSAQEASERRKSQLPRQILLSLLLTGIFFAGMELFDFLPGGRWMENRFFDRIGQFRAPEPMDPRILLTLIPESFWTQKNTQDIGQFSQRIERILGAGAKGVAIDLLLPERCGQNADFIRLLLQHGDRIRLSLLFLDDGRIKGTECIQGLLASAIRPKDPLSIYCFINVPEDEDGILRRYRTSITDRSGRQYDSLGSGGARLMFEDQVLSESADIGMQRLNPSLDWRDRLLPWDRLEAMLDKEPDRFQNALLFIGGESNYQEDVIRIPPSYQLPDTAPGVVAHANIAHGILSGNRMVRVDFMMFRGFLCVWSFLLTLWIFRTEPSDGFRRGIVPMIGFILYISLAGLLFLFGNLSVLVTAPILSLSAVTMIALFLGKRMHT